MNANNLRLTAREFARMSKEKRRAVFTVIYMYRKSTRDLL
jgi:hypothetical protein